MKARQRGTRWAAVAAVMGLLGVSACQLPTPPGLPAEQVGRTAVRIGFSAPNLSAQLLLSLSLQLRAYAESKGAELVVADPDNDPVAQAEQIKSWIELREVQAIWVIAVDAATLIPVYEQAHKAGVAVLANGTPEDYGQSTFAPGRSYSFIDYRGYGRDVGAALARCAEERLAGRAKVVSVQNPPGNVGSADFAAGLRDGLAAGSPDSRVVADVDGRGDRLTARQAVAAVLRAEDGVNAVVGATDDGTWGALGALTRAGRDATESCAVAAGGSDESRNGVKSGQLYAVVALDVEKDVAQNVDLMLRMVADPEQPGSELITPTRTIRK